MSCSIFRMFKKSVYLVKMLFIGFKQLFEKIISVAYLLN